MLSLDEYAIILFFKWFAFFVNITGHGHHLSEEILSSQFDHGLPPEGYDVSF